MRNIKIKKKPEKECIDKISNEKVLPHKSYNILMDLEYDKQILLDDICNNLNN